MTFNTEKNKLQKLWNEVENNKNIILTQKDQNTFIVDNIENLNKQNTTIPILTNFSSDWIVSSLEGVDGSNNPIVDGSFAEFKLTFNNLDITFVPYIHCEVIYRVGTSGVIPLDNNPAGGDDIPFDEALGGSLGFRRLEKNEIFQINETNIEYTAFMRMDFFDTAPQDVQYKFICYILNPHYYQTN